MCPCCWFGIVPRLFDEIVEPLGWQRCQCLRALAIGPAIVAAAVVATNDDHLGAVVESELVHAFALLQDLPVFLHRRLGGVLADLMLRERTELFCRWPPDQLEPVAIVVAIDPPGVGQLRIQ